MCAHVFLLSIRAKKIPLVWRVVEARGGLFYGSGQEVIYVTFFATLGSGRSCIIHTLFVHKVDLLTTCLFERADFFVLR